MFSGQLQPYLEPRKLADQGAELRFETRVSELPRLSDFGDSQDQPVSVHLVFGREEDGARTINGTIETRLAMTCQRCLEAVDVSVNANVSLTMVWTEAQSKALADGRDPYLVHDEKMPTAELLEEEILLALPPVAVHEQCPSPLPDPSAGEAEESDSPPRENPFAVLAKLKQGQRED